MPTATPILDASERNRRLKRRGRLVENCDRRPLVSARSWCLTYGYCNMAYVLFLVATPSRTLINLMGGRGDMAGLGLALVLITVAPFLTLYSVLLMTKPRVGARVCVVLGSVSLFLIACLLLSTAPNWDELFALGPIMWFGPLILPLPIGLLLLRKFDDEDEDLIAEARATVARAASTMRADPVLDTS